jgi:hypothetical protein
MSVITKEEAFMESSSPGSDVPSACSRGFEVPAPGKDDHALKAQRLYCTCGGAGCDTCRPELFVVSDEWLSEEA